MACSPRLCTSTAIPIGTPMTSWLDDAVLFHLFPLGASGAPAANDFTAPRAQRLDALHPWLAHLRGLGANTLLLGPVCESGTHGYDTADLFHVDRRLGDDDALVRLCAAAHAQGLRVVF